MRKRSRVIIATMSLLMFALSACGKAQKREPNADVEEDTYVYIPEELEMQNASETIWAGNVRMFNHALYYKSYKWDEETQTDSTEIVKYDPVDGTTQTMMARSVEGVVQDLALDSNSNIYLLLSIWKYDEETGEEQTTYLLEKYSVDGEAVYQIDITDELVENGEHMYVQEFAADAQGRLYLGMDNHVKLHDEQGE